MAKAQNSLSFFQTARIDLGWVQHVGASALKGRSICSRRFCGSSQLRQRFFADSGDDLAEFDRHARFDFFGRGGAAHQHVPGGDREFAGHCGDGNVDFTFAGQQFFAPLG
jgi:hypothetical protein